MRIPGLSLLHLATHDVDLGWLDVSELLLVQSLQRLALFKFAHLRVVGDRCRLRLDLVELLLCALLLASLGLSYRVRVMCQRELYLLRSLL